MVSASFVAASLAALALAYALIKRLTRPSLTKIRGPQSSSFVFGNLVELTRGMAGDVDFEWQNLYGDVVRFKTVFGEDALLIADPKALHRIFNTSGYRYPKLPNLRELSRATSGKGVLWAEGEDHKRHRRILLPGFGGPESKAFLGVFKGCAESMCIKWMEAIGNSPDQKAVIDVHTWLSRGTLDAIGQAAFDVQFGVVQDNAHRLAKVYRNALHDIFGRASKRQIFILAVSRYIPPRILAWMANRMSNRRFRRAREMKAVATQVAKELVHEKAASLLAGKGSRDIFSLLIKANMDSEAKHKLTEEEMLAQMRTILFAGHESTYNTLSWILLELARHPEMQFKLRAEIRETEAAIQARGDTQFTIADFEVMPYMMAVVKEGLRYHPVVPRVQRIANGDDILPLARPITTEFGETLSEIVIPKGTQVFASIAAYNRNKELWGEDAHEFNPDRWLGGVASEKKDVPLGVYSNLMTFIGGTRACLGWRFAVIEIQAFVVEVVGKFELTMTERSQKVFRGPSGLMSPMIEGELDRGGQLPLAVSLAPRYDDA